MINAVLNKEQFLIDKEPKPNLRMGLASKTTDSLWKHYYYFKENKH